MSYNTVAECNDYVASHYLSSSDERQLWEALSDTDKQILLTRSFDTIESLPFTGRKTSTKQPYAFPRYPDKEVPIEVKYAECELALALSNSEAIKDLDDYRRMITYGIQSYSIGNFSETLLSYQKNSVEVLYGLISDTAKRLLNPWLTGGFRIG